MTDYPAKRKFRGRGPWEKQAVQNGYPPEFQIGDKAKVTYSGVMGRVTDVSLRVVDPPIWQYEVAGRWYFATEIISKESN